MTFFESNHHSKVTMHAQRLIKDNSFIPIIELLIICLKDGDASDFPSLYNQGFEILGLILEMKLRDSKIRQQYKVGGIITLLMLAFNNPHIK